MDDCQWRDKASESQHALEREEASLWMDHLLRSPNPVLAEGGGFIGILFNLIAEGENGKMEKRDFSKLSPLEVYEAEALAEYFASHSNAAFNELADWIPQWMA